jgi:hypothetical protein
MKRLVVETSEITSRYSATPFRQIEAYLWKSMIVQGINLSAV